MSFDECTTEAAAVAEIAARPVAVSPTLENPFVAVPSGFEIKDFRDQIAEMRGAPFRQRGYATFSKIESFVAYVNRFKRDGATLYAFAHDGGHILKCVIDHHTKEETSFNDFGAAYPFKPSSEWLAWARADGRSMEQKEFAEFVEDRITEVCDPASASDSQAMKALLELLGTSFATPSKLLELSRSLSLRSASKVVNATNLSTGEATVVFESTVQNIEGGPVKFPGAFLIAIPVYTGGTLYRLAVRLRFRIVNERISFRVEMHRAENALIDAFESDCSRVQKETDLPLYYGRV